MFLSAVALILALNPGNAHSPTLARLARELRGCELIGAESSVAATAAIRERVPDVVLLPAKPARGEADLIAHLKTIPGGVMTLKLPPNESADAMELARQIREMLTGTSAPAGAHPHQASFGATPSSPPPAQPATSPHVLAAATAAVTWGQTRRAAWARERAEDAPPKPVPLWTGVSPAPLERIGSPADDETYEPYEPIELTETDVPFLPDEADAAGNSESSYAARIKPWLPRAAAGAALLIGAGALFSYWSRSDPVVSSTTIAVTATEPAEVSIDGRRVGDTPFSGTVNLGTHSVTVRTAAGERRFTVEATRKPVALEVDFSKP